MDSNKRRSLLKKRNDSEEAQSANRTKRISFSGKKAIREFTKENVAKCWDHSYEVSDLAISAEQGNLDTVLNAVSKCIYDHAKKAEPYEDPATSTNAIFAHLASNTTQDLTLLPFERMHKQTETLSESSVIPEDTYLGSFSLSDKDRLVVGHKRISALQEQTIDYIRELSSYKKDIRNREEVMKKAFPQLDVDMDISDVTHNQNEKQVNINKRESYLSRANAVDISECNFETQAVDKENIEPTLKHQYSNIKIIESLDNKNAIPSKTQIFSVENDIETSDMFNSFISKDKILEEKSGYPEKSLYDLKDISKNDFTDVEGNKSILNDISLNTNNSVSFYSPILDTTDLPPEFSCGKKYNLRQLNDCIEKGKLRLFTEEDLTPLVKRNNFQQTIRGCCDMDVENTQSNKRGTLFFNNDENREMSCSVQDLNECEALDEKETKNLKRDRYRFSQADEILMNNTNFLAQAKLGDETLSRNSSKSGSISNSKRSTVYYDDDNIECDAKTNENPQYFVNAEALRAKLKLFGTGERNNTLEAINKSELGLQHPTTDTSFQKENTFDYFQESLHSEKQCSAGIKQNVKNNDKVEFKMLQHDQHATNISIPAPSDKEVGYSLIESTKRTPPMEKMQANLRFDSIPREKADEISVNACQKDSNIFNDFKKPHRQSIYDPSDMDIEDDSNVLNETKNKPFILIINENDTKKNIIDNSSFIDKNHKIGSNGKNLKTTTTRESIYTPSGMEIENKINSPSDNTIKSMNITAKEHTMGEIFSEEKEQIRYRPIYNEPSNLDLCKSETKLKLNARQSIYVPTAMDVHNEEASLQNKSKCFPIDDVDSDSTLPGDKQVKPAGVSEDDLHMKRRASVYCVTGMDVDEDLNLTNTYTAEAIIKEPTQIKALESNNGEPIHNRNFTSENVQIEEMELTTLMDATSNNNANNESMLSFGVNNKDKNESRKTVYYNCNLQETINEKPKSPLQEKGSKDYIANNHTKALPHEKKRQTLHSNDDMQIEEMQQELHGLPNLTPIAQQDKIQKKRQTTYENEDLEIDIQINEECKVDFANETAKMDEGFNQIHSQTSTIKCNDKNSMFYMKEKIVETIIYNKPTKEISVKEADHVPVEEYPDEKSLQCPNNPKQLIKLSNTNALSNNGEGKSRFQSTIYDIDDLDIEKLNDTNVSIESAPAKYKARKTVCLNEDLDIEENENIVNLSFNMSHINIQDDDDNNIKVSDNAKDVRENKNESLFREEKINELNDNNSQLNSMSNSMSKEIRKPRNTVLYNENIEILDEQSDGGHKEVKQSTNAIKGRATVYINEDVILDEVASSKTAYDNSKKLTESKTSNSKYIFEEIDLITENINYKKSKANANLNPFHNSPHARKEDRELNNSFELMKVRNVSDFQRKTMIFVDHNDIETDEANATLPKLASDLVKDQDSTHSFKEQGMVAEQNNDKLLFETIHKKPYAENSGLEAKSTASKSLSRLIQNLKKSSYETPKKKVYKSVEMTPLTKPKSLMDSLVCHSLLDFEDMEQECGFNSPNKTKIKTQACDISQDNQSPSVQDAAKEKLKSRLTVLDMETDGNKTYKKENINVKNQTVDMDISISKALNQESLISSKRLSQNMTPNQPFPKKRQTVHYKDSHIVEEGLMSDKTVVAHAEQHKNPRKLQLFPDAEAGKSQIFDKTIDTPELPSVLIDEEAKKQNISGIDCSLKQSYLEPVDVPRRLYSHYTRQTFLPSMEISTSAGVSQSENIEKFYNITLGTKPSEDIEKTHLSLVETILDDTEDETLSLPTIDLTYSNKKSAKTFKQNANQKETTTQHKDKDPLCQKCKGCEWPTSNEPDMSLIDINKYKQKFTLPDMKTIRSKQMNNQPTIRDIVRTRMRESLANAIKFSDMQDEEEVSEKKFCLKEVFRQQLEHSAYRIAELERSFRVPTNHNMENTDKPLKEAMMKSFFNDSADMKQKLSELKQIMHDLRTPQKSFVERLQILMRTNNKNWVLNTKLQAMNKFVFYHKKVETSLIEINYEEIDNGANIRVKNVKLKRQGFSYSEWLPFHHILEFQLQLELPYPDLIGYCPGNDELSVCDMLSRFDHIFLNVKRLVIRFWFTILTNGATLIRDGPLCYVKKTVRKSKNLNGGNFLNKHYTLYIAIRDIPKLSFKDITRPALHLFDESITSLPTGLEFAIAFLGNPLKFIKPENGEEHTFL